MKIEKIAVGLDASEEATVALQQALPLARRFGAEVVLLHVGEVFDPPGDEGWLGSAAAHQWNEMVRRRHEATHARLAEFTQRYGGQGVRISQSMMSGFPDTALCEAATEVGADLVVVGTHGRGGFQRFMLGSVAERVVRLCESCDVLVARRESAGRRLQKLVVGTDFSETSEIALQRAIDLAEDGASIRLVHCWQFPTLSVDSHANAADMTQSIQDAASATLNKLAQRYQSERVTIEPELRLGKAAYELGRVSAGADLMVVGSHGRRGFRRFFLGSVAEKTLRQAACSVYVARAKPSEEEGAS